MKRKRLFLNSTQLIGQAQENTFRPKLEVTGTIRALKRRQFIKEKIWKFL